MIFPLKFIVVAGAFTFAVTVLGILPFSLYIIAITGILFSLLFLGLELLNVNENALEITYELISVVAAIGWVSIICS